MLHALAMMMKSLDKRPAQDCTACTCPHRHPASAHACIIMGPAPTYQALQSLNQRQGRLLALVCQISCLRCLQAQRPRTGLPRCSPQTLGMNWE